MLRPALGTLVFALVVVGPVVALVPWVVSGWRLEPPLLDGEVSRWIGAPLFLIGLSIWGDAALRLAMIFGQALFLGSRSTLTYGLCAALGFHLFVVVRRACAPRSVRRGVPGLLSPGAPVDSAMVPRASGLKRHDLLSKPHQFDNRAAGKAA